MSKRNGEIDPIKPTTLLNSAKGKEKVTDIALHNLFFGRNWKRYPPEFSAGGGEVFPGMLIEAMAQSEDRWRRRSNHLEVGMRDDRLAITSTCGRPIYCPTGDHPAVRHRDLI